MVTWVDGAGHFVPADDFVDQEARMRQVTCVSKSLLLYSVRLVTSLRHNEQSGVGASKPGQIWGSRGDESMGHWRTEQTDPNTLELKHIAQNISIHRGDWKSPSMDLLFWSMIRHYYEEDSLLHDLANFVVSLDTLAEAHPCRMKLTGEVVIVSLTVPLIRGDGFESSVFDGMRYRSLEVDNHYPAAFFIPQHVARHGVAVQ
jgi:hypothetical protein